MNRTYSLAISAAVIVWSLPLAPAKPRDAPAAAHAKAIFEEIDENSAEIADVADRLEQRSKAQGSPELQMEGLETLRADVNRIGKDLKSLDAERDSLESWEVEALDRTTSLMHDVATNTEKAIETFTDNRNQLWATSYPAETAKAADEADQVKNLLTGYLKLAKAREREGRLEQDLSGTPHF